MVGVQELSIVDEIGRKVKMLDANMNTHTLQLTKGIYFVALVSENGRFMEKIVVH